MGSGSDGWMAADGIYGKDNPCQGHYCGQCRFRANRPQPTNPEHCQFSENGVQLDLRTGLGIMPPRFSRRRRRGMLARRLRKRFPQADTPQPRGQNLAGQETRSSFLERSVPFPSDKVKFQKGCGAVVAYKVKKENAKEETNSRR